MRAIVYRKYGPPEVLRLEEVDPPRPRAKEVLIKVRTSVVSSGDCRMRSLDLQGVPFLQRIMARLVLGVSKPRNPILGLWLAGEVEAVGQAVEKFRRGDQVFARTGDTRFGAYAEFICLPEDGLIAKKPANLTFEEAVAIPFGAVTALFFLRKAELGTGQSVLVHGASGSVGTAAVQLAKHLGAEVTGVCSAANVELVKSLGADRVIDYTRDDLSGQHGRFDVVFDSAGKLPAALGQALKKPSGRVISVVTSGHAQMNVEDLELLGRLAETGKLRAVIDKVYPLEQMAEAHRYVDLGHKKGNVVITVARHDGSPSPSPGP